MKSNPTLKAIDDFKKELRMGFVTYEEALERYQELRARLGRMRSVWESTKVQLESEMYELVEFFKPAPVIKLVSSESWGVPDYFSPTFNGRNLRAV